MVAQTFCSVDELRAVFQQYKSNYLVQFHTCDCVIQSCSTEIAIYLLKIVILWWHWKILIKLLNIISSNYNTFEIKNKLFNLIFYIKKFLILDTISPSIPAIFWVSAGGNKDNKSGTSFVVSWPSYPPDPGSFN